MRRLVVIAIGVLLAYFVLVGAWWAWNLTRPLPSDAVLKARFREHRDEFDSLAVAALADTQFVGAAHDWMTLQFEVYVRDTPSNDRMLSPSEVFATGRSKYRRLLDRAGIPAVSRRGGEALFVVGSRDAARKGILYSTKARAPMCATLDGLEKARSIDAAFVALAPHWYLFIEPHD